MFTEPNGLPSRGKNIKILLIATRIARRRKEMAALLMMDLASKWISTWVLVVVVVVVVVVLVVYGVVLVVLYLPLLEKCRSIKGGEVKAQPNRQPRPLAPSPPVFLFLVIP
jgi:hypothetical protein